MTHPLTDELIEEIAQFEPDLTDPLRDNRTNDMRSAADWQLKQVINWCSKYVHTKSVDALREAMRPQENN